MHDHIQDQQAFDGDSASKKKVQRQDKADVQRALEGGEAGALDPNAMLQLQRAAGNASVSEFVQRDEEDDERHPVRDVIESGDGRPLEPDTRAHMEQALGHDFGDVRVHTDQRAADSAAAVQAKAYTAGSNVVFGEDQYAPETPEGARTLAHELTHVAQQRSGPVDGTPVEGGIKISDPSDRFEQAADAAAEAATAGEPPVQRQEISEDEEPEEEPLQALALQRQEELAEEQEEEPLE